MNIYNYNIIFNNYEHLLLKCDQSVKYNNKLAKIREMYIIIGERRGRIMLGRDVAAAGTGSMSRDVSDGLCHVAVVGMDAVPAEPASADALRNRTANHLGRSVPGRIDGRRALFHGRTGTTARFQLVVVSLEPVRPAARSILRNGHPPGTPISVLF